MSDKIREALIKESELFACRHTSKGCRGFAQDVFDYLTQQPESEPHEREIQKLLERRDELETICDQLAARVAELIGIDIGEHSSANCPWTNALEAPDKPITDPLNEQPESELNGTVGNCYGPDNRGLYRIAVFSGTPFPVGTTVYASPQPSPQVPNGFNRLAYNRKTDEWLYINHAGEWQLCPCPVPQAAQVPAGYIGSWELKKLQEHGVARIFASSEGLRNEVPFYLHSQPSAQVPDSDAQKLCDWLYRVGYVNREKEQDYDPRGRVAWQACYDAITAAPSAAQVPEVLLPRVKNLLLSLAHQGEQLNPGEPPYDVGEWGIREAQELYTLLTAAPSAQVPEESRQLAISLLIGAAKRNTAEYAALLQPAIGLLTAAPSIAEKAGGRVPDGWHIERANSGRILVWPPAETPVEFSPDGESFAAEYLHMLCDALLAASSIAEKRECCCGETDDAWRLCPEHGPSPEQPEVQ